MTAPQLFPKPKRTWRLKQPRKDAIRFRAEVAEAQLAYARTPWWWRIWHRISSRLREADSPVPNPKESP